MPVYSVQGPDGKIYDVEGPAGATADQLGAFITQNAGSFNAGQSAQPDNASAPRDGYKVTITGTSADEPQAQAGGASGSWMPGGFTLDNLQHQLGLTGRAALTGAAALPNMIWNGPIGALNAALGTHIPTADANATANALGLPQPQNGQERIVQDAASGVASLGGLAGPAQGILKLADAAPAVKAMPDTVSNMIGLLGKNVGTQARVAAAGAGASGGAREAGLPGAVQVGAGLLAGGVPDLARASIGNSRALLAAKNAVPSVSALKQSAADAFNEAARLGVAASPAQTSQLAGSARAIASKEGLIAPGGSLSGTYPKVADAIKTLDIYAGGAMGVPQMQTVRKVLQNAAGSSDKAERRVGTMLLNRFDDFTSPLAPQLAQGRALYTRAMRGDQLETINDLADLRKAQFSGSGEENALRTEYRGLARKITKGQERGWTPAQAQAIELVAKGTPYSNAMRYLGKFAPSGLLSVTAGGGVPYLVGNTLGGPAVGGLLGAGTMATGLLARRLATRAIRQNTEMAGLLARNGGALNVARPGYAGPLGGGLLAAQAASN